MILLLTIVDGFDRVYPIVVRIKEYLTFVTVDPANACVIALRQL